MQLGEQPAQPVLDGAIGLALATGDPLRLRGPLRVLTVGAVGLRKGSPYVLEVARALQGVAQFRMVGSIGITAEALAKFNITEFGYAMPLEVWAQAARAGLKIVELPVPLIYLEELARHRYPLFQIGGSYVVGVLVLLLLQSLTLIIHELGHAMAVKHAGRCKGGPGSTSIAPSSSKQE